MAAIDSLSEGLCSLSLSSYHYYCCCFCCCCCCCCCCYCRIEHETTLLLADNCCGFWASTAVASGLCCCLPVCKVGWYLCVVGCEYGDRVFWCHSYSSLDCTDPPVLHDCCQTCTLPSHAPAPSLTFVTRTASFPVITTTTMWRDVTTIGSCPLGDGASFCATMPVEECYHFPELCCDRCSSHYTSTPGMLSFLIEGVSGLTPFLRCCLLTSSCQ